MEKFMLTNSENTEVDNFINDFIKNMKKISEKISIENFPSVINEILNDFAISNTLFSKFRIFFNLFFPIR